MLPHQYFLNRQMQTALYVLKRQYGGPIVIYRLLMSEVDLKTGEANIETIATRIKRAVILPATVTRDVIRNISVSASVKQFVQNSSYDASKRIFIVDKRDARNLSLSSDDWLVWDGHKYQFEKFDELEFNSGWIITGKVLLGETDLENGLEQSIGGTDTVEIEANASGGV